MLVLSSCDADDNGVNNTATNTLNNDYVNDVTNTGGSMTKTADVRVAFAGDSFGEVFLFEMFDESTLRLTSFAQPILSLEEFEALGSMPAEFRTQPDFAYDFNSKTPNIRGMFMGRHRVVEEAEIELTQEQTDIVRELINNVTTKGPDREFERPPILGHLDYILAIIDGDMYWSLYHWDIENASRREWLDPHGAFFNIELLLLSYELRDLSPTLPLSPFNPKQ